jgi:hypothetical protein
MALALRTAICPQRKRGYDTRERRDVDNAKSVSSYFSGNESALRSTDTEVRDLIATSSRQCSEAVSADSYAKGLPTLEKLQNVT